MLRKLLAITLFFTMSFSTAMAQNGWKNLFDGKSLKGWEQINGTATYTIENGEIIGTTVSGSPNSFIRTNKEYGDFILEFDAKLDHPMNSGVQIRSLSNKNYQNDRVHGYQIELDTSPRAWTAGIYDEARSGWLYSLTRNKEAREAFKQNDWNHIRVEAIGNSLRTWLNGVPAANLLDDQTAKGFIALQVHSISDKETPGQTVRWKNIRIKTDGLEASCIYMGDAIEEFNYVANTITPRQKAEGWKLLFDGKTSNGWIGAKTKAFPTKGWEINDGVLSVLSSDGAESTNGGDIITEEEFSSFELELDFKISKGANSGIKYFVDPELMKGDGSAIGLEYQILDDQNHPDAKLGVKGNRTVASLYDLITASNLSEKGVDSKRFNGIDTWNRARIVVNGQRVEHWLNNSMTLSFYRRTQTFRALVAYSKYKDWENFGEWENGPILLQDHGDLVSFRSIKIKNLDKK